MAKLTTLGKLSLDPGRFTQPKPLALLAYLALEGPQQRRHMAELFWPGGQSLKSLSMAITRLRRASPESCLTDGTRLWCELDCDAVRLLAALDAGDLGTAEALYGGAFLGGLALPNWGVELEEWVLATREGLAERFRALLLTSAEQELAGGRIEVASGLAARAYRLAGAAPAEPETLHRLHRLLSTGHHPLADQLRQELAEFGLPDQAGPQGPVARLDAATFATPFVGREEELATVAALLEHPEGRMVTLLGPGGSGKSRLALQAAKAAETMGSFPDGIYLAFLDDLAQPASLPLRLSRALGVQAPSSEDPWAQLAGAIGHRRLLLVLDNVEQLRAAAEDLAELLDQAHGLRLLLTSRERLGLAREQVVEVAGLPLPRRGGGWDEAQLSPAVQLFRDRALAARANLDLAAQASGVLRICGSLGGLPLALELAAGWLRLMPAAELADLIDREPEVLDSPSADATDRHGSLHAVVETSWRMLEPEEREVLARLSVFVGGFRRDAAAAVAGIGLRSLATLLDRSWLRSTADGRLDRHPHLYAFTRQRLAERPQELAELQARHAAWCSELARLADASLRGPDQLAQARRLSEEHANLLAALDHYAQADPGSGLALAADLGAFWSMHGHDLEGLRQLRRFLDAAGGLDARSTKARLRAAQLAERLGQDDLAGRLYQQVLEEAAALQDPLLQAQAHLGVGGCVRQNHGDYDGALEHFEAGLHQARLAGHDLLASDALRMMGVLVTHQGAYERAVSYYEEAGLLAERSGDLLAEAKVALSLSVVLVYMREMGRARYLSERSLAQFRLLGDRMGEASALANIGSAIDESGDARECKRLYLQSLAIIRQLGDPRATASLLNNLASVCNSLGEYDEAQTHLEESLSWLARSSEASLTTHALYLYGVVLLKTGDRAAARRRLDECIELCRRQGETWALMRALIVLGRWHVDAKEPEAALACAREAASLAVAAGDPATERRAQALIEQLLAAEGTDDRRRRLVDRRQ